MVHITDEILRAAIDAVGADEFDSHAVIERITRIAPKEYALELHEHIDVDDPILAVHSLIGRALSAMDSLTSLGTVLSTNIGGNDTPNENWKRIKAVVKD